MTLEQFEALSPVLDQWNQWRWFEREELTGVPDNQIFTLVDAEGEHAEIVAGFWRINSLAYIVTALPFTQVGEIVEA